MTKGTSDARIYSYSTPMEYKVVALRECPLPFDALKACDTPQDAVEYWRSHVETMSLFNPECECLTVIFLNTRLRIKGHQLVTLGTMNSVMIHAREVFRTAIVAAAFSIVVIHNHPSGDPSPSAEDIRTTRDLVRAGQIIRIEITDHIIIGAGKHVSLRELGFV